MLRIYNRMSSISGVAEQSVVDKSARLRNEMAVNVYGDLVITSSKHFLVDCSLVKLSRFYREDHFYILFKKRFVVRN